MDFTIADEFTWEHRRVTLQNHLENDKIQNFLTWAVIQATMNTDYKYQYYHLNQWQLHTGLTLSNLNSIVEFGGGYGAMLKCLRELGFRGEYYSYDFPELIRLQEYFTGEKINTQLPKSCDLLIAICSLSEVDHDTKDKFLSQIDCKHLLIRYQYYWGWNNHEYFTQFDGFNFTDSKDLNHRYLIR